MFYVRAFARRSLQLSLQSLRSSRSSLLRAAHYSSNVAPSLLQDNSNLPQECHAWHRSLRCRATCPASKPRQPAKSYESYGSYGHTVIRWQLGTSSLRVSKPPLPRHLPGIQATLPRHLASLAMCPTCAIRRRTPTVPHVLAIRPICAIWVLHAKPLNPHTLRAPCYMSYMHYMLSRRALNTLYMLRSYVYSIQLCGLPCESHIAHIAHLARSRGEWRFSELPCEPYSKDPGERRFCGPHGTFRTCSKDLGDCGIKASQLPERASIRARRICPALIGAPQFSAMSRNIRRFVPKFSRGVSR